MVIIMSIYVYSNEQLCICIYSYNAFLLLKIVNAYAFIPMVLFFG